MRLVTFELVTIESQDITCGHKTKDIIPPIARTREEQKEEARDNLSSENHAEKAIVSETSTGTVSKATLREVHNYTRLAYVSPLSMYTILN